MWRTISPFCCFNHFSPDWWEHPRMAWSFSWPTWRETFSLPLQHSGCCPNPQLSPGKPDNFLFPSGIEGEDHPFLTANAENSSFLSSFGPLYMKALASSYVMKTTFCRLRLGGCGWSPVRLECILEHFLPRPSEPSVLGLPRVLGDVKGQVRERGQESCLLPLCWPHSKDFLNFCHFTHTLVKNDIALAQWFTTKVAH